MLPALEGVAVPLVPKWGGGNNRAFLVNQFNFYVRSGATGAQDGSSWQNAFRTLTAATAAASVTTPLNSSSGGVRPVTIWVASDNAESSSSPSIVMGSVVNNPLRIISALSTGSVPPSSSDIVSGATVTSTSVFSITTSSSVAYGYFFGIVFNSGNTLNILTGATGAAILTFDSCTLKSTGTTGISILSNVSSQGSRFFFINTTVRFSNAIASMQIGSGVYVFKNTASFVDIAGTIPTNLITNTGAISCANISLYGIDLSGISTKTLLSFGGRTQFYMEDCKLPASFTFASAGTFFEGVNNFVAVNCDSSATSYRYYKQNYSGIIQQETTIVRTSPTPVCSDGTTTFSRKLVSTASTQWFDPLESGVVMFWNESTSAQTITVPVITDGVTLTTADAWIVVEYMGSAATPQATFLSTASANVLTVGTAYATDSTNTWTTTGLVNPVKQLITSASFAPALKGWISVRVYLARPSTTMYFDPMILPTSARCYMTTGDVIVNEADDPAVGDVRSGVSYNRANQTGTLDISGGTGTATISFGGFLTGGGM